MIRNPTYRRITALALLVAGAAMMWFAPEVWWGVLLLGIGISLEVIGVALERAGKR